MKTSRIEIILTSICICLAIAANHPHAHAQPIPAQSNAKPVPQQEIREDSLGFSVMLPPGFTKPTVSRSSTRFLDSIPVQEVQFQSATRDLRGCIVVCHTHQAEIAKPDELFSEIDRFIRVPLGGAIISMTDICIDGVHGRSLQARAIDHRDTAFAKMNYCVVGARFYVVGYMCRDSAEMTSTAVNEYFSSIKLQKTGLRFDGCVTEQDSLLGRKKDVIH